jgi:hypothetical protein
MAAALGASTLRGLLVFPTIILATGPHKPLQNSKLVQMIRRTSLSGEHFFLQGSKKLVCIARKS